MIVLLLAFIIGIIIFYFIAKLIVNSVPKKLRTVISIFLWLIIAFLGYKIYQGVMGPIEFNKKKKVKYAKVIDNLKMIRDAEIAHKEVTGKFTDKSAALINFIATDSFAITEVRNEVYELDTGGGIMATRERRVVDTTGYKPVRANFAGRDYKNMFTVPGTDAQFELKTGFVEKVQGVKASVFEAKVDKAVVLKGLNIDYIRQEKEALGGPEVRGAYLSVGSLDNVKTSGNWPPSYDTNDEEDKDK